MKCKVRLTHTVELYVEGKSEEAIWNWLLGTTPQEAKDLAKGKITENHDKEMTCPIVANSVVNYVIKEEE